MEASEESFLQVVQLRKEIRNFRNGSKLPSTGQWIYGKGKRNNWQIKIKMFVGATQQRNSTQAAEKM